MAPSLNFADFWMPRLLHSAPRTLEAPEIPAQQRRRFDLQDVTRRGFSDRAGARWRFGWQRFSWQVGISRSRGRAHTPTVSCRRIAPSGCGQRHRKPFTRTRKPPPSPQTPLTRLRAFSLNIHVE
eukprot:6173605-Pleurochrysis_carterae.AAC.5